MRLCRLKRGTELLAEGKLRVKEVADQLGFSSTSYFTTCFMRQFGMPPTEFKSLTP
ncbi:MAG: AraC family transcriptional regulator [Bacteroidaceae bacterium]|nr:AraC family transcriptional regulator [Bacteroidaceae bacterium]